MIALAGKMAKADGMVSDAELQAFERVFHVPPSEQAHVRRIFNLARQDVAGYEAYAGQIAKLFVGNPGVLEDVLDGLFEIAKADGVLHPAESQFLERVADIFGFAPNEFRRIRASHFAPELTDPYVILGVSYVAGEEEIRQTYRRLVRENHPDSLIARGVPEEFVKLANDKLASINGAYEKIQAERGLKP
jgi:DnaJ like chaperone protein